MDAPKKPARKKSAEAAKEESPEPGVLETAAKTIGSTLGAVAVKTGIVHPKATPARVKIPKLAKKDKHRLPRKLKKHLQKEAARKAS
jgi:hypothetical protein